MERYVHISEAAKELGVNPQYLRILEWEGRIPPARRDLNGRIYSEDDLALLQALGVGSRPSKLRTVRQVLASAR
jgi:DNA-binding transcriptional MerR regulator